MKIKNFKDFKNLKPHRNLNIFHEVSIQTSQKTENKLKVCPRSTQFQLQKNMAS